MQDIFHGCKITFLHLPQIFPLVSLKLRVPAGSSSYDWWVNCKYFLTFENRKIFEQFLLYFIKGNSCKWSNFTRNLKTCYLEYCKIPQLLRPECRKLNWMLKFCSYELKLKSSTYVWPFFNITHKTVKTVFYH